MCIEQCPLKLQVFIVSWQNAENVCHPMTTLFNEITFFFSLQRCYEYMDQISSWSDKILRSLSKSDNVEIAKNGKKIDIKLDMADFLLGLGHGTKTLFCVS